MNLVDFSTSIVFSTLLIFCRVGSAIMFLPGVGETFISPMIRLTFAVLLSIMLVPLYQSILPPVPNSSLEMALLIGGEITIGIVIGMTMKIILSAIHVLGMTISYQSGLSSGMMFDPSQGTQGTLFGNLLSMIVIVLIISGDLHYILIKGITNSYNLFTIGSYYQNYDDFTNVIIKTTNDAFNVGIQMSAPFIVGGLLLFIVSGVLSRLMPQLQIFFLMLPVQIILSLIIFMASISAVALWFIEYYTDTITNLFG
jgi:flagellar biosynthetic protein FliR